MVTSGDVTFWVIPDDTLRVILLRVEAGELSAAEAHAQMSEHATDERVTPEGWWPGR